MPQMCRYPGHEHTSIKAKNRVTFSLYFSSGKGLVTYGTPLCPLFRKSRYSAYYGCSKILCFVFVVYRFSVLLFRPRKTIFWNSKTFSDLGVLLQYLSKKSVLKGGRCLFMEEGSLCLKCAATQVTNTHG